MCKIMVLLDNSSETTWPVSTKWHVDPTVETELRVCSDGHARAIVMPMYEKTKKQKNKKQKKIYI